MQSHQTEGQSIEELEKAIEEVKADEKLKVVRFLIIRSDIDFEIEDHKITAIQKYKAKWN